jgi:peroxiredoxin
MPQKHRFASKVVLGEHREPGYSPADLPDEARPRDPFAAPCRRGTFITNHPMKQPILSLKTTTCLLLGLLAGALSPVRAQEHPAATPVQQQLDAKAAEIMQAAPEAARTFADGIAEVAASGIVEQAPKVGDKVVRFELPGADGRKIRLADLLKQGPVVLAWYRGGWCPYCNISLHALVEAEPAIRALGATLVAITPETPDSAAATSQTIGLTFPVLTDQGNRVAHQYRIAYKNPAAASAMMKAFKIDLAKTNGDTSDELPLPATFVVDRSGTIRWAFVDADYRKRADPADILAALKGL